MKHTVIALILFCVFGMPARAQDTIIFPVSDIIKASGMSPMALGKTYAGIIKSGTRLEAKGRSEKTWLVTIGMIRKGRVETGEAVMGEEVALELKGIDAGEIKMGMVLSTPGTLQTVKTAEVSIDMSGEGGLTLPLKTNSSVQVILYGNTEFANIVVSDGNEIKPGDKGMATLKFSSPVAIAINTGFKLKIGGKIRAQGVVTKIPVSE